MSRQRTTTPRQWELLPNVDIFVRVGFASVVIQALCGGREPVGESGHDLDARAIASVTVPGADCGDP